MHSGGYFCNRYPTDGWQMCNLAITITTPTTVPLLYTCNSGSLVSSAYTLPLTLASTAPETQLLYFAHLIQINYRSADLTTTTPLTAVASNAHQARHRLLLQQQ